MTTPKFERAPVLTEKPAVEVFDPTKELRRIKEIKDGEEKRREIQKFKESLVWQKEGIAEMQGEVIDVIEENPDANINYLLGIVEGFGDKYQLNPAQRVLAKRLVFKYQDRHEKVRRIRNQHKDDAELYGALFGRPPKGKVEVVEGPATLYFRCHDLADYAFIRSGAFLSQREPMPEEIKMANMEGGGVSMGFALAPGLERAILVENAQGRPFDKAAKAIYRHEEQHAINKFFQEAIGSQVELWGCVFDFTFASTEKERELTLKRYLRARRKEGEVRAGDEILAFSKDELRSPEELLRELAKPKEEGGLYDYYSEEEKRKIVDELVSEAGKENRPLFEKTVNDVFEKEYRDLLKAGINAFQMLKVNGYSTDQAINILTAEPLARWPKVVARLLKPGHGK